MRTAAAELLGALIGVFALERTRWYVFGAQAVNAYGRPRMTADVDVTAELDRLRLAAFIAPMAEARFEVRVENPDEFLGATSVLPFLHTPTGMPLDVVVAGSELEALFLGRAVPVDVGGIEVPMIRPEDLVVTKALAGRTKDLEDIVSVLRERGKELDLDGIRDLLREIERALDQSDLVPAFERAVKLARPKKRSPRG